MALALALVTNVSTAQAEVPTRPRSPEVAGARALNGTFVVVKVDAADRALVLEQSQIGTRIVRAGPDVAMAALRPGERIEATYYPEVALSFHKAVRHAGIAREGATEGHGVVTEEVAVDGLGHTVTVRGHSGNSHVIHVTDRALQAQLEGLRSAKLLALKYTCAVAVSAHPLPQ